MRTLYVRYYEWFRTRRPKLRFIVSGDQPRVSGSVVIIINNFFLRMNILHTRHHRVYEITYKVHEMEVNLCDMTNYEKSVHAPSVCCVDMSSGGGKKLYHLVNIPCGGPWA